MNVDIVCSSRELFGADRSALRLARVLRDVGTSPRLVVPEHRPELGLGDAAARLGIEYRPGPVAIASSRGAEGATALLPRVGRNRSRADVSIANTTAVLGTAAPGRRKILMIREWLEPGSLKHRALGLRHRAGLDAVVGISEGVLQQWRACVPGPRVQALIPNWLEDAYLPAADEVRDKPAGGIVCLGRFNQWKGQEVLAEAFERAFATAAAGDRPRLTFLGAQPGTPFQVAADAMAARGRASGWEVLPFDDDPRDQLDRAALLVLPSLHPEPFGMVILEALARGCRVIAFPGGGPDDLAEPFGHALTVVPRGADPLAAALRAWWEAGGPAQTPGEWRLTLDRIRGGWSHAATLPRWEALLAQVAR